MSIIRDLGLHHGSAHQYSLTVSEHVPIVCLGLTRSKQENRVCEVHLKSDLTHSEHGLPPASQPTNVQKPAQWAKPRAVASSPNLIPFWLSVSCEEQLISVLKSYMFPQQHLPRHGDKHKEKRQALRLVSPCSAPLGVWRCIPSRWLDNRSITSLKMFAYSPSIGT